MKQKILYKKDYPYLPYINLDALNGIFLSLPVKRFLSSFYFHISEPVPAFYQTEGFKAIGFLPG